MISLLYDASVVLVALSTLTLTTLAARRVLLARTDRRRAERELRMRPVVMGVLDGGFPPELDRADSALLSETLGRYATQLRGEVASRIATYFEEHGDVAAEISALDARALWRRATAAHRLGDMGSQQAVVPLLERLREDPERSVGAAAVRSLGGLGGPAAPPALVTALARKDVPPGVASQALLALGAPALPALRELACEGAPEQRSAAVELIGELGEASDEKLLIESLGHPSADVRAGAARALRKLAGPQAARALREALNDRMPFVRRFAAEALGALGDREAMPALIEVAQTDEAFDAAAAAARAAVRIDADAVVAAARSPDAGPHVLEAADRVEAGVGPAGATA